MLIVAFIALFITIWMWHYDKHARGGMLQKKNPYDMLLEQSMTKSAIVDIGKESFVVDVDDRGD